MGDLKYFLVNAGFLEWGLVTVILLIGFILFFIYFENKINALITSFLYGFSLFLFIVYGSLHPFLITILALFWLLVTVIVAIGIYGKHLINNPEELKKIDNKNQSEKEIQKQNTGVLCPHCSSKDVQFMQNDKKSFSVRKAAAGAVLTGGVGVLAGFAGKKGENEFFCQNCNRTFKHRN